MVLVIDRIELAVLQHQSLGGLDIDPPAGPQGFATELEESQRSGHMGENIHRHDDVIALAEPAKNSFAPIVDDRRNSVALGCLAQILRGIHALHRMSPRLELRKEGTVVAGDIQDLERDMPPELRLRHGGKMGEIVPQRVGCPADIEIFLKQKIGIHGDRQLAVPAIGT